MAEYRFKRTGAGIDIGYNSGRRAEVRLGVDAADVRGRVRVGSPFLPEVEGREEMATLQFTFDGQNSPVVPSRGLFLRSRLRRYFNVPEMSGALQAGSFNVQKFWQGEVEGTWFTRARRGKDRVFARYGAGTSFGDRPLINTFSLGGPLRLGAFNNEELRDANYLLGTVGYLKGMGRLPDVLGGNIFVGGWFEQGTAFDTWKNAKYQSSVSVGGILETLLGPVFGGASVDFNGRSRFYIAIGPLFH